SHTISACGFRRWWSVSTSSSRVMPPAAPTRVRWNCDAFPTRASTSPYAISGSSSRTDCKAPVTVSLRSEAARTTALSSIARHAVITSDNGTLRAASSRDAGRETISGPGTQMQGACRVPRSTSPSASRMRTASRIVVRLTVYRALSSASDGSRVPASILASTMYRRTCRATSSAVLGVWIGRILPSDALIALPRIPSRHRSALLHLRGTFQGVPQSVAEGGERQNGQHDHHRGRDDQARCRVDIVERFAHHRSPRSLRWLYAEAEEAQTRLRDDRHTGREGQLYEQRRRGVGQNMTPHQASLTAPECPSSFDVRLGCHRFGCTPGEAIQRRSHDQPDRDHRVRQSGTENADDRHREDERGQRLQRVGDPADQPAGPSTDETREQPGRDADYRRHADGLHH